MKRTRNGKTLIELSIVIGILSMAMTLSARTLLFLMRADADGRKSVTSRAGFSQLSRRFRRDVHAAANAELVPAAKNTQPQTLKLTMPDGLIVEFRPTGNAVDVVTLNNGNITQRERFTLPGSSNSFEVTAPDTVTFSHAKVRTVTANSTAVTPSPTPTRVIAIRGRDLRTVQQTSKK